MGPRTERRGDERPGPLASTGGSSPLPSPPPPKLTRRTSSLSIPIPNATVAQTTGISPPCHFSSTAVRSAGLIPAWYAADATPARVRARASRLHSDLLWAYTMAAPPLRSPRSRMPASFASGSDSRSEYSTEYLMLGRLNERRTTTGSDRPSCRTMSDWTALEAVAVSAMRGAPGSSRLRRRSSR